MTDIEKYNAFIADMTERIKTKSPRHLRKMMFEILREQITFDRWKECMADTKQIA